MIWCGACAFNRCRPRIRNESDNWGVRSGRDQHEPRLRCRPGQRRGFIKSNAFAVECPAELFEIQLAEWPADKGRWDYLREIAAGKHFVAGLLKGKVLALGTIDAIKTAIGDPFKSIVRTPISGQELSYEDGVVVNLLRTALLRSMAAAAGLACDERGVIWEPTPFESQRFEDRKLGVHQAAVCFPRKIAETMYLVVKPTLLITQVRGLASYEVPKIGVLLAATFQSKPGAMLAANYAAPNAVVAPSLGRDLSGNAANVTVNLVPPGTAYGDRINQFDIRAAKTLRYGRSRTLIAFDVYNTLNSSAVLTYDNTFVPGGQWLQPLTILTPRFFKITVEIHL